MLHDLSAELQLSARRQYRAISTISLHGLRSITVLSQATCEPLTDDHCSGIFPAQRPIDDDVRREAKLPRHTGLRRTWAGGHAQDRHMTTDARLGFAGAAGLLALLFLYRVDADDFRGDARTL